MGVQTPAKLVMRHAWAWPQAPRPAGLKTPTRRWGLAQLAYWEWFWGHADLWTISGTTWSQEPASQYDSLATPLVFIPTI